MTSAAAAMTLAAEGAAAGGLGAEDLRALVGGLDGAMRELGRTHERLHAEVARLQSELAEANRQLSRSRELAALGEMAAGIAHEVRNPLASIELYAQMLVEDLADRPEQQSIGERIRRAVADLDAVVRDVLLFAREMRVRPEPVEAEVVVARAIAACDGILSRCRCAVHVHAAAEPMRLDADAMLLAQAFANVVRNAAEIMAEHGTADPRIEIGIDTRRVRLGAGQRVRCVIVSMRDHGPGIPPEVVHRMFNPFFTTRPTGTGLGLAIVQRIVDAHGGLIAVSSAPGGGALVEFRLPESVRPVRRGRSGRDSSMCREAAEQES